MQAGWGRSSEDDLLPHPARSETRRRTGSGFTTREREPTEYEYEGRDVIPQPVTVGWCGIGSGRGARLEAQTPFEESEET